MDDTSIPKWLLWTVLQVLSIRGRDKDILDNTFAKSYCGGCMQGRVTPFLYSRILLGVSSTESEYTALCDFRVKWNGFESDV